MTITHNDRTHTVLIENGEIVAVLALPAHVALSPEELTDAVFAAAQTATVQ